jgi:Protein of unknown function (DUF2723)
MTSVPIRRGSSAGDVRWRAPSSIIGIALTAEIAIAYLVTCARTVGGGDNGEFALIFAEGGVPHPSGYPVYVLWLRALAWLPASSPAHGAALATAILGIGCAIVIYLAARAWGATPVASATAVAVFAFSARAWTAFTQAEVFGLNALIAGAIVLAAAPGAALRPTVRATALGALAGLGMSGHLSIVLLAPLGLYAAVRAVQSSRRPWKTAALALAAFAACLLPYAYLFAVARMAHQGSRDVWVWGTPWTPGGLFDHFTRRTYGTSSLATDGEPDALPQLVTFAESFASDLLGVFVVVGVAGLILMARRRRAAAIAYAAAIVLAGPVFISMFNIPLSGTGRYVVARFYLLPELLFTPPVAIGLDAIFAAIPRWPRLHAATAQAVALVQGLNALPVVREHNDASVERALGDALASLPPRAVVLTAGDVRLFGFAYLQRAKQMRPDVVPISTALFHEGWYLPGIEARIGVRFGPSDRGRFDVRSVVTTIERTGRPILMTDYGPLFEILAREHPTYPEGTSLRVLPASTTRPPAEAIERKNLALFARMTPPVRPPADPYSWASFLYENYGRTWGMLADELEALHDDAARDRCRAIEARFALPQAPP